MTKKEEAKKLLDKAKIDGYLTGTDFSLLMSKLLISDGGWVIHTGDCENVNAAVALMLEEKIKKHPLIWKLLFMVA